MPRDNKTRPTLITRIRSHLFTELGGCCALAEERGEECDGPLEIDHPFGRDWVPHRVGSYNRWLRYRREHEQGLVRLLCRYHNETVRPKPRMAHGEELLQPF